MIEETIAYRQCPRCNRFRVPTDFQHGKFKRKICRLCLNTAERGKGRVGRVDPSETERKCVTCREVFPLTSEWFGYNKCQRNGFSLKCKICTRIYDKASAKALNDNRRKKDKRSRLTIRLGVMSHYCNGQVKCACCGESNIVFLAIDHINGGGGRHRREINAGGAMFYRWLRDNGYPEGFRVLCHNCNMATTHGRTCPHQAKLQKETLPTATSLPLFD